MSARKKNKLIEGVTIWKKKYCENIDGRHGFKCPVDGSEWDHYSESLDLNHKDASSKKDLYKWFDLTHKNLNDNEYIIFGHWASIEGKTGLENIIGLDTGCVWGKKLTAIRLEDKKLFSVDRYESL